MTAYKHGLRGYTVHGCRCEECKTARAAWWQRYSARKLAEGVTRHGDYGYRLGCRCDECRAAKAASR